MLNVVTGKLDATDHVLKDHYKVKIIFNPVAQQNCISPHSD